MFFFREKERKKNKKKKTESTETRLARHKVNNNGKIKVRKIIT